MNQNQTPFERTLATAVATNTVHGEALHYRDGRPLEPGAKVLIVNGKPVTPSRTACCRCGGSGIWRGAFEGVCFRCGGKGVAPQDCRDQKLYTLDEVAKLDATQTKRQAAKQAKLAAERNANEDRFNAAHADLLATIPAAWIEETPGPASFWAQFNGYTTDLLVAEEEGLGYKDDFRPKAPSALTIVRDIVLKGRRFGSINGKQADLVAKLVIDGQQALAVIAERVAAREQAVATSQFVGTEGGKVAVAVTLVKLGKFQRQSFDGRREETVTVCTFVDATGNLLVTKTPTFGYDLTLGQTGTLTGTVKLHSTYQGVKQTQVIRPKLTA